VTHPPGSDLLDALLASLGDAVYLVDADGRVRFANPAAVALLGYDREEELLGAPSHATIHHTRPDGTPFPEAECPLLRPRATGETVRVDHDWFVRRDGGLVPVAYSSAPVQVDGGRGAVVAFRDISEALRAQAERVRAAELHASRARIVAAADAERRRLGRDLHDGAQARLVNVAIALQLAAQRSGDDDLVADALGELRIAMDELRDLASGLLPSVLTNRGLGGAVETLTARAPVPVTASVPDDRYDESVEVAAYFVVAEALANVAKHAEANEAWVEVARDGDALAVEIRDDGRGGADRAAGSGLRGLADRVAALDGTLEVDSPPGGGTRVRARLPLATTRAAA
jgi:PAS domain S-box-containing protein